MRLVVRIRLVVARHPWIYWLAVAAAAAGVALGAARAVSRVDAARLSWGRQQTVWVAAADVEPGQSIRSDRRQVPRAMVPLSAVGDQPDGQARQHIGAGEIITAADVAGRDAVGLVPDGWVAFAVPAAVDHFATGDHVRLFAADQLIASGVVVDRGDADVMVAVPADAAPATSAALLAASVTVGLTATP